MNWILGEWDDRAGCGGLVNGGVWMELDNISYTIYSR